MAEGLVKVLQGKTTRRKVPLFYRKKSGLNVFGSNLSEFFSEYFPFYYLSTVVREEKIARGTYIYRRIMRKENAWAVLQLGSG